MKKTLKMGGKVLRLNQPLVMGILNFTPDSFYKDSRFNPNEEVFLKKAGRMLEGGATILDVGGYSTRPGSKEVSEEEEMERVIPAIQRLRERFPEVPISVDTFRASVAGAALQAGAEIVNDISGGDFDSEMFRLIISQKPVYVLMHQGGNSIANMHQVSAAPDILPVVLDKLFKKAADLRRQGVTDILLDPGFGFSKSLEENYRLLQHFELLQSEHYALLAGMSRKSMIWKTLEITPEEALPMSIHLHGLAMTKGANALRVHDPLPYHQLSQIHKLLKNIRPQNNF